MTLFKPIRLPAAPGSKARASVVSWSDAKTPVYAIRQEVFVEEQHLTHSVVDDPDDQMSVHVLATMDSQVVGIGRVTFLADEGQIAWVAVRQPMRRHGVGLEIMRRLIAVCIDEKCRVISLNAQTHALSFYERLGFRALGRRFRMAGIEHQHMMMVIDSPDDW
ncbi:MAG TPA: GNAT family N-acetyltransferase, partial [Nitrolancea sp.]|nr:GNAT family N-acetyltransferase [Nitrolancea sp.]